MIDSLLIRTWTYFQTMIIFPSHSTLSSLRGSYNVITKQVLSNFIQIKVSGEHWYHENVSLITQSLWPRYKHLDPNAQHMVTGATVVEVVC